MGIQEKIQDMTENGVRCITCRRELKPYQKSRWLKSNPTNGPFCTKRCATMYGIAVLTSPPERELEECTAPPGYSSSVALQTITHVPAGGIHPHAMQVIDHFVALFPERAISARTPQNARLVSARLEGFTVEQLMLAADGLKVKAFNTNKGYTAIRHVYKDDEQVENFILCARNPAGANVSAREIERRATIAIREKERELEREQEQAQGGSFWSE